MNTTRRPPTTGPAPALTASQETLLRELWLDTRFNRGHIADAMDMPQKRLDLYAGRLELGPNNIKVGAVARERREDYGYAPNTWPTIHECFTDDMRLTDKPVYCGNVPLAEWF